jgi:hypothetical protein
LTGVDWPPKKIKSLLEFQEIFGAGLKLEKRPKWEKQKGPFSRMSLWWGNLVISCPLWGTSPILVVATRFELVTKGM